VSRQTEHYHPIAVGVVGPYCNATTHVQAVCFCLLYVFIILKKTITLADEVAKLHASREIKQNSRQDNKMTMTVDTEQIYN